MIRYTLDWIREDRCRGNESILGFIGVCMFILVVLVALVGPAVFAARDAGNKMKAAHKRGEYTTFSEECELKNELIRARIRWYDSNHNAERPE